IGQANVRRRPIGSDPAGLLEQGSRLLQLLALEVEPPAEGCLIRLLIHLSARLEAASLSSLEAGAYRARDVHRNLSLKVRQLPQSRLIVSRQEHRAVGSMHKSHTDTDGIGRP